MGNRRRPRHTGCHLPTGCISREPGLCMAPQYQTGSGTMSDEGRDHFEIPQDMRSMAEASFDQARKAFEKFVSSAQATAGSIEERGGTVRAGAKDISATAMS